MGLKEARKMFWKGFSVGVIVGVVVTVVDG